MVSKQFITSSNPRNKIITTIIFSNFHLVIFGSKKKSSLTVVSQSWTWELVTKPWELNCGCPSVEVDGRSRVVAGGRLMYISSILDAIARVVECNVGNSDSTLDRRGWSISALPSTCSNTKLADPSGAIEPCLGFPLRRRSYWVIEAVVWVEGGRSTAELDGELGGDGGVSRHVHRTRKIQNNSCIDILLMTITPSYTSIYTSSFPHVFASLLNPIQLCSQPNYKDYYFI